MQIQLTDTNCISERERERQREKALFPLLIPVIEFGTCLVKHIYTGQ